jgi:hypothetical protein
MYKPYIASKDEKKLLWTLKQLLKTENEIVGKETIYSDFLVEITNHYDLFNQYLTHINEKIHQN